MGEYYIDKYRDHYAIFNSNGEVEAQYDTHKEAKEDLPEYENMNEGLVGWAILFGALGLTALYSRIDNAIQNRKNKNKPAPEAIGITEKEINTISNQIKNLKNDIISKQKSSSLYKNLYQYMKSWNDDKYIDAITALKSGESLDLGLELRTDVYYAFVEFFDLTNNDFIKQLKDPDDDDESEKLEIKYETESFNEMKKHLSSLGFDLNNEIESRYYFSKKYPDLIIRFIDSDDGVGVIIQPKCILKTNNHFKMITDKDAKKLNEDYSEVNIDPEMEQLMKLAGVTTEDLDDLEDDDLDDVMDESQKTLETEDAIKYLLKDTERRIETFDKLVGVCEEVVDWTKSHHLEPEKSQKEKEKYEKQWKVFYDKMGRIIDNYNSATQKYTLDKHISRINKLYVNPFGKLILNDKSLNDIEKETHKKLDKNGAMAKKYESAHSRMTKVLNHIADYADKFDTDDDIPHDSTSFLFNWISNNWTSVIRPLCSSIIEYETKLDKLCGNAKTGHFKFQKIRDLKESVVEDMYELDFMMESFLDDL